MSDKAQREAFPFIYFAHAQKASITDYKLCLTTYLHPNALLLSGNSKDIPEPFFNKVGTIVIDKGRSVHAEFLFQFNAKKYKALFTRYQK